MVYSFTSFANKGDSHEPFIFHAILFIAMLFMGLSFISMRAEAALASDISYGDTDYLEDPMFERLPNTYGQAFVENVWFANNRAYSTHSAYIGNYAGGDFGPQDILFDLVYLTAVRGPNGENINRTNRNPRVRSRRLQPYYDGWANYYWSEYNYQQSVSTSGLQPGPYLFTAYTDIQARDQNQALLKARWHAEYETGFTVQ